MSFNFLPSNYLCITSSALLIPFSFYMNNAVYRFCELSDTNQEDHAYESILAAILLIAIYASQWFWYNPIKNGISHIVDGFVAKVTLVSFFLYTIFYKQLWRNWVYVSSIILLVFFAVMSRIESSKDWCCQSHLMYHGGLHLISAFSGIYAFT